MTAVATLTFDIVHNDGRHGPGRLDWLLLCDGKLVSHSGNLAGLAGDLERLRQEAYLRVCMPVVLDREALEPSEQVAT